MPCVRWAATSLARCPPGAVTAYSNYGAALAGYLVEVVSGEPFAQYVERHILAPLDMRQSTFAQPLPSKLAEELAVSYRYDDTYHAAPFEYFQIAPAASLSATATGMAWFMIAHLRDGRLGDSRVLEAATAQDMHRRHFTNNPHVNGMIYGFADMAMNGQRLLVHSGTTNDERFRILLVLVLHYAILAACAVLFLSTFPTPLTFAALTIALVAATSTGSSITMIKVSGDE
jgi:CubicO group peptidase (beta-lactamase class C family)